MKVCVKLNLFLMFVFASCSSYTVTREHEILQNRVLKLHEKQIWYNLLAVRDGGTPMHLDYSNFQGEGYAEVSTSYSYKDDDTFDPAFVNPNNPTSLIEIDNDGFNSSVSGTSKTAMKVSAQPAVGEKADKIFKAYSHFPVCCIQGPVTKIPSEANYFVSHKIRRGGRHYYYYLERNKEYKGRRLESLWRQLVIDTTWKNHRDVPKPSPKTPVPKEKVTTLDSSTTTYELDEQTQNVPQKNKDLEDKQDADDAVANPSKLKIKSKVIKREKTVEKP